MGPGSGGARRAGLAGLLLAAVLGGGPAWPEDGAGARVGVEVGSGPIEVPAPGPTDTCPVCGMFVAKYPDWIATVLYRDGHAHHFDGAKDLFKYLLNLPRWAPGHRAEDIARIAVTDYYEVSRIDAREAWYVIGSDVLGPMGHELIPFPTQEDAAGFQADHGGKAILRCDDLTPILLDDLDAGRFPSGLTNPAEPDSR